MSADNEIAILKETIKGVDTFYVAMIQGCPDQAQVELYEEWQYDIMLSAAEDTPYSGIYKTEEEADKRVKEIVAYMEAEGELLEYGTTYYEIKESREGWGFE